jgi:hypothetical protein
MAITTNWYGLGLLSIVDTPTDLEAVTLKLALVLDTYTPNRDTHDFRDDFTSFELSNASGYTTGGNTLTGVTWSYDAASDQVRLDCDDTVWSFSAARTWRYGIGYIDTGGADTTDPLIFLLTWDSNQTVSTTYTLQIDTAGLLYLDTT